MSSSRAWSSWRPAPHSPWPPSLSRSACMSSCEYSTSRCFSSSLCEKSREYSLALTSSRCFSFSSSLWRSRSLWASASCSRSRSLSFSRSRSFSRSLSLSLSRSRCRSSSVRDLRKRNLIRIIISTYWTLQESYLTQCHISSCTVYSRQCLHSTKFIFPAFLVT